MQIDGFSLMSEIVEKPVEWLWPGYIPLGETTIVEGHPGTNKSSLTHAIAACLTQGTAMPCAPPQRGRKRKGGALFLTAEDSLAKTVRGRLFAAGADLTKIGVLGNVLIPEDLFQVEKAIAAIDARLLVVDTINDFLSYSLLGNQAVRKALHPLRDLAERMNIAVVMIRHFTKSSNSNSLLRGGGSVGITAVARSQLKVYKHPDDLHLRVLVQDKSSLGPLSPSLLFEVAPTDAAGRFRLEWHGECSLAVEDLERKHKRSPRLEAAEKFLLEKLASGRRAVNAIIEDAKGICSKRTLDAAKQSLEIKTIREGNGEDHKVYWALQ
jgi:hypothetical protein